MSDRRTDLVRAIGSFLDAQRPGYRLLAIDGGTASNVPQVDIDLMIVEFVDRYTREVPAEPRASRRKGRVGGLLTDRLVLHDDAGPNDANAEEE